MRRPDAPVPPDTSGSPEPTEDMAGAPVSRGRRFLKLAGMTARVAGSYARHRVGTAFQSTEARQGRAQQMHTEVGERIARTLGELKGAAMKLGQMASLGVDLLPKEVADALQVLQREAQPMAYSVIAAQIERELGQPPERLYRHFDPAPFASASIGQVHRATLDDGREVVVKVQYPGVDTSVDSDLAHLKMALRASGLVRMKRSVMNDLFAEVRERLHEELDYCNEADNVRLFRAHHAHHPNIVVPDVVGERSAQRMLTLTYEAGLTVNELADMDVPQSLRDQLGLALFDATLSQIFDLGAIQSDPNPANFAFRTDGTVVLYDFGCVKKLDPSVVEAWGRTIRCALLEDYAGVERGMLELGARNPDGPAVEPEFYARWRNTIFGPFFPDGYFDYAASTIHTEIKRRVPDAFRHLSSFQPPVQVVFLHRIMGGHYWNLRKLRSRGYFLRRAVPYLGLAADDLLAPL